jgi:hypothetical protein
MTRARRARAVNSDALSSGTTNLSPKRSDTLLLKIHTFRLENRLESGPASGDETALPTMKASSDDRCAKHVSLPGNSRLDLGCAFHERLLLLSRAYHAWMSDLEMFSHNCP